MTTPVFTSENQSDGVKMDMTTPVLTTKVLCLFYGFCEISHLQSLSFFFFVFFASKVSLIFSF